MTIATHALADQAAKHLDEAGPLNTCWSNGPERWAEELGLPGLDTGSVSAAERAARAGVNGWRYHDGTAGLSRGHVADWKSEYLNPTRDNPHPRHVTVVDEVEGSSWRGIGSGTPSGRVARQPANGGMNPKSLLTGYFIAPAGAAAGPDRHDDPEPGDVYTVVRGDYLQRIATRNGTTVKAILAANPRRKDGRSADFHIARASLIVVGQRIHLP